MFLVVVLAVRNTLIENPGKKNGEKIESGNKKERKKGPI